MDQPVSPAKAPTVDSYSGKKAPLAFFLEFLRHPLEIGSVIPSSRFMEQRIISAAGPDDAKVLVELGCGTGGTTRALLDAMSDDARLIAIDLNPRFINLVSAIADTRLIPVLGSAADLGSILKNHGFAAADVVVSGIPFSTMSWDLGSSIVESVHSNLVKDGRFVAYQASKRVQKLSEPVFGRGSESLELLNIPPMRVHRWLKH